MKISSSWNEIEGGKTTILGAYIPQPIPHNMENHHRSRIFWVQNSKLNIMKLKTTGSNNIINQ